MFAKDVLRVLQVSRPTFTKYVKTGIIRVHVMPNGHYDYNEEDGSRSTTVRLSS